MLPSHYKMEGMPMERQVTVTFEEEGTKTKMTIQHETFSDGEMAKMTGLGWGTSLDKMEEALKYPKTA